MKILKIVACLSAAAWSLLIFQWLLDIWMYGQATLIEPNKAILAAELVAVPAVGILLAWTAAGLFKDEVAKWRKK